MNRFEDNLWETVVEQHGDDLSRVDTPGTTGARRPHARRGVLAGGTLGLAALGAGLTLAFSGSTAPPAFAITRGSDGSVLVHLRTVEAVPAAERQLAAMGVNEWFEPMMDRGTTTDAAPVKCTAPDPAQAAKVRDATHRSRSGVTGGPQVSVLLGKNGNGHVGAGQSGAGAWHLFGCYLYSGAFPGTGNTGSGTAGGS